MKEFLYIVVVICHISLVTGKVLLNSKLKSEFIEYGVQHRFSKMEHVARNSDYPYAARECTDNPKCRMYMRHLGRNACRSPFVRGQCMRKCRVC